MVFDRGVQALVVEPSNPVRAFALDLVATGPASGGLHEDQFGLLLPDLGLHQDVVEGGADAADRLLQPGRAERIG